jgi:hypothetical protein
VRRGSIVGPLILIAIGALFLVNNLNPELSVLGLLSRFWPFVLIGWGVLRLIEIMFWAMKGTPLPAAGLSGGEWTLIVFVTLLGSSLFFVSERVHWPPVQIRMKGVEVFGKAYDYPLNEQMVATGAAPRVIVDNSYGNARIIGADTAEIRVSGRKTVRAYRQQEADEASRRVDLKLTKEADIVHIYAQQESRRDDQMITTDLEITVPRGARVEARGRRGDFDVTEVRGDVEVDSDNAGIRLQEIGGNVRVQLRASDVIRAVSVKGSVDLKGYGHDVELEDVEGQVTVAGNYFGNLQFRRLAKPVRFEGGVRSRTSEFSAQACPGQIRMEGGTLAMEGVTGPVIVSARSKDVQLTDFTQSAQVRLDRGDVEIRPSRMPLPQIDVVTDSGDIELVLPEAAKFTLKAVASRGEIENEFGDVLKQSADGNRNTLIGSTGQGPELKLQSGRGSVRVRKGSPAEFVRPPAPLPPPKPPSPSALVVENN